MRLTALIAVTLALLAGCGASTHRTTSSHAMTGLRGLPTPVTSGDRSARRPVGAVRPSGPVLVYFKRVSGVDPLGSYLIIHTNGTALAVVTNGGIEGEVKHTFALPTVELSRLRHLVTTTRPQSSGCCNLAVYSYWLTAHSHSWRVEQGLVPTTERPLIRVLDALSDAHENY